MFCGELRRVLSSSEGKALLAGADGPALTARESRTHRLAS
jgi:hypothetical protein